MIKAKWTRAAIDADSRPLCFRQYKNIHSKIKLNVYRHINNNKEQEVELPQR